MAAPSSAPSEAWHACPVVFAALPLRVLIQPRTLYRHAALRTLSPQTHNLQALKVIKSFPSSQPLLVWTREREEEKEEKEEEEEEEKVYSGANAVNEEDPERDRAAHV